MGDKTGIEWTDATWNPVRGCTRVSPGCGGPGPHGGCYAEGVAARFSGLGQPYEGLAHFVGGKPRWTGKLALAENQIDLPLRWQRPRRIFVNSMSDLFHKDMPVEWIDAVFAVMVLSPQHTHQVLTKRPDVMAAYLSDPALYDRILRAADTFRRKRPQLCAVPIDTMDSGAWHPNIWLGTSIEDQQRTDERRESLRAVADRGWLTWISYEPALGMVDWTGYEFIKWLVSGGESGPLSRPAHPDWHRVARDFCLERGIAYLFKQHGNWAPYDRGRFATGQVDEPIQNFGKKLAGRLLDGVEHNGYPKAAP